MAASPSPAPMHAGHKPAMPATSLNLTDLTATVEPVHAGLRPDGRREALLYVTLRAPSAHPGRDVGPRTCMALSSSDARALAQALLAGADQIQPNHSEAA